jgi:hypothetical protein
MTKEIEALAFEISQSIKRTCPHSEYHYFVAEALTNLGYLSPDQLSIRDAETTRRALEMAAMACKPHENDDSYDGAVKGECYTRILALQPAPTGWKLVPEQREFICKKCHARTDEGKPENYHPF